MSEVLALKEIQENEVDIVIGAVQSNLTSFMNEWKPFFGSYHLIIVKDPDLNEELQIPNGFNVDVYTKSEIEKMVGLSKTNLFSGYSCRYFGYLVSRADFVRGYPFSLRTGVHCGLSCGLWLNLADFDAPTQALKPDQRNSQYVDAIMTVPARALLPISGINIAFDRELVGPSLVPSLRLSGEGKVRWETMEDIWSGMCVKVVCDHLGFGVKTGLPYVWRQERGNAIESLKKEWEGVKLMEEAVPFFQSVKLSPAATSPQDCIAELANAVKEKIGSVHPVFSRAADSMTEYVNIWKKYGSSSS
ncbi:hypothetical protein ACFE04_027076 [Oxalis oulophora]